MTGRAAKSTCCVQGGLVAGLTGSANAQGSIACRRQKEGFSLGGLEEGRERGLRGRAGKIGRGGVVEKTYVGIYLVIHTVACEIVLCTAVGFIGCRLAGRKTRCCGFGHEGK